jgi:exosortase
MSTTTLPAASAPPGPALARTAAWVVVALGAAAILAVLAIDVWPKRPEMGDRFLIPIASGVLVYLLRPRWRTTPRRPAGTGLLAVAAGAVSFPPAWYLLVQVGPRTLLLWWLAAALTLVVLGLLVATQGWRRAGLVAFPMLFAFFALPTPDNLQARLLPALKDATTAGAAAVLPWLGVPAIRSGLGFTLTLPTGQLGVVDACSGALSLTSLLAIAVLTANVRIVLRRDFTVVRGIALVGLTIPIVVVSNTVRVVISGLLHESIGPAAVQGVWHDVLGYTVVLVGFALILGTSQVLAVRKKHLTPPAPSPEAGSRENVLAISPPSRSGKGAGGLGASSPLVALLFLLPAAAACLWSEQFRQRHFDVADLSTVPLTLPGWDGQDEPVPPDVVEMLKCDQIVHREYADKLGRTAEVYLMFWATPASTAHIHHPDVCWPARGCTLASGKVRPVSYAPGREPLGVSVRHYDTPEGHREIVFYWTQNGNTVLPDGQEPGHGSEYAWVIEMLRGRQAPQRVSRLSVLIATGDPLGRPADQEDRLARLGGEIAAELYRVCPWAEPTP